MTSWASARLTIPRTARRVVCGLSLVMAILVPTSAFVRVDLPALGRPTKQQNPERNDALRRRLDRHLESLPLFVQRFLDSFQNKIA